MAIANYQIPSKLTFYPSYLQYAYAAGLINGVDFNTQNDITEEDVYKLAILDPLLSNLFGAPNSILSLLIVSSSKPNAIFFFILSSKIKICS